jgi:hypothetical protein
MNKQNLIKMVDFLKALPPEKFYFGKVVAEFDLEHRCGTVCCAVGWMPKVFPDLVRWNNSGTSIVMIKDIYLETLQVASRIFEIQYGDLFDLFYEGRMPGSRSSFLMSPRPVDIANLIVEYIAQQEAKTS